MKRFAIYISVLFQVFLFSSLPVFAEDSPTSLLTGGLNNAAAGAGYNQSLSLPEIIGRLIAAILGVVGIILVIRIIQAGILYMTANGEPAKTATAKKMITEAVIGIIIMIAAYALTDFVITQLANAVK